MTGSAVVGRRARRESGAEAWGLADQALVSGVNFLTIIVVARALAPSQFGYFVLAFTALQTCGMLQAALLTRPHNVLGAVRRDRAYADYSTTVAAAQVVLAVVLALLAAGLGAVAHVTGTPHASLVLALAPAVLVWQLQELGRRMLYTERRMAAAFCADLVAYGLQAIALVVVWRAGDLTGARALLVVAVTFALGAALVAALLRTTLSGTLDRAALLESWRFGKWLGAAEVGQWLSTHFIVYLAAAVVGPIASAALKAGQTLLGPMSVYLTFVTSYLPTELAQELEGSARRDARSRHALARALPVVACYGIVVGVLAGPVLELVYGAEYRQHAAVVQLFAVYYVALAFSTVAVAVLAARGLTRQIFVGYAASAVVSLAFGWMLLEQLGPEGGVAAMLVSWSAAMALFLRPLGTRALVPSAGWRAGGR